MSSGGGQSGETIYNWNPYMENMWAGGQNGNGGLLGRALTTLNSEYQNYPGRRVAGLSADQETAGNAIRHTAINGSALGNAGRNTALETVQGQFLDSNPYNELRVTPGSNQYEGMSEDYQALKRNAMKDLTDAYSEGTAADTQRMFAQSGAFGGSAHQQAQQNNARELGRSLSRLGQEMDNTQYERSANLRENAINRGMQAQQFDIGRLNQDYQNERGLMQGAIPMAMQGDQQAFDAYRNLMGVGDLYRSYDQQLLDRGYEDWANQQNWERNNINWMANLLGQAQGSTGITQQMGGYQGINPVAGLLGAASIGRGMQWF